MSEENKQKENKTEKVKVNIQGREFELIGKYNKVDYNMGNFDITFDDENKPKISFNLLGAENTDVKVNKVGVHKVFQGGENFINVVTNIFPANNQRISFKIGDFENNIEASSIYLNTGTYVLVDTINFKTSQKISFKIGDVENKDVYATFLVFHANGNVAYISFFPTNSPQKISFKIGDINYQNIEVDSISFYNTTRIKDIYLAQGIRNEFFYKKSKYQLSFQSKEIISFNNNGELSSDCIKNSIYREQEIERQDQQRPLNELKNKTNNLEKQQEKIKKLVEILQENHKVATREDWVFVGLFALIGFYFILNAFCLCFNKVGWWQFPLNFILPDNFDKMSFDYHLHFLNSEHKTFNRYTFLYEILKRAPIIILAILGFKFLQLAFERLRLIGEVEKVQKYLNLAKGDNVDNVKNNLLGIIAIPFFAQNKVKSRFFDRLIDKTSINIGSERESGGVISKEQKEQAVKLTSDDGVC